METHKSPSPCVQISHGKVISDNEWRRQMIELCFMHYCDTIHISYSTETLKNQPELDKTEPDTNSQISFFDKCRVSVIRFALKMNSSISNNNILISFPPL